MFKFTLIDDGDSFKSAMRMFFDSAVCFSWSEFVWTGIVEQQEWVELIATGI